MHRNQCRLGDPLSSFRLAVEIYSPIKKSVPDFKRRTAGGGCRVLKVGDRLFFWASSE